jgi:hypothetical protein
VQLPYLRPVTPLRVLPAVFSPADAQIIVGRFEWWFKQCDEWNLNRRSRDPRHFGNAVLSNAVPLARGASQERAAGN